MQSEIIKSMSLNNICTQLIYYLLMIFKFLAGKEKSHEVFFIIYNELVNNRKQICIASDRLPKEIKRS